jgi:hypothetical protein
MFHHHLSCLFVALLSPRLTPLVWILATRDLSTVSCAVSIVSKTYVLTVQHGIAFDPKKPTKKLLTKDWVIAKGFERKNGVVRPIGDVIQVTVVFQSPTSDWALLKRTDSKEFEEYLSICPKEHIPADGSEERLKIYHCAIDMFNGGLADAVKPICDEHRFGFATNHRVVLHAGLFGGSSGGIYAIRSNDPRTNGYVLAMHVESVNTARHIESEISADVDLISVSDSHAEFHGSFINGLIICRYRDLYKKIVDDQ